MRTRVLLGFALSLIVASWLWGQTPQPAAIAQPAAVAHPFHGRVPWLTSRVVGSPEPPLPFRARRAYPHLQFERPIYVGTEPGTQRLLLVEQSGKIWSFDARPETSDRTLFYEMEDHDIYSFAFHPDYPRRAEIFLFTNGPNKAPRGNKFNKLWRVPVKTGEPSVALADQRTLIIEWGSNGHNGGDLGFGNDGMLYATAGDGTSDSDENVTGQDLSDLCSGMLRLDVDHPAPGQGYAVPSDNPFLKIPNARPELWAFGFRNPWRMFYDRPTGDLWVGDVGQDLWEQIHLVQRGGNYGWSAFEGSHPFHALRKVGPAPVLPPAVEHPHAEARSITGGIVYRGKKYPDLVGHYVYGDYATGKFWSAKHENGKVQGPFELMSARLQIVAFGADPAGELLLVDYTGTLHELVRTPPLREQQSSFPRKLSETGLFVDVAQHQMHPGIIPYSVIAALWSDGSDKYRFVALPDYATVDYVEGTHWRFPEHTVLVKTFTLPNEPGADSPERRIETRLLLLEDGEWVGYSYAWNAAQTDADLVGARGQDATFQVRDEQSPSGRREQIWHFPSRAECMVCHSRAAAYVLGLNTYQMDRLHDFGRGPEPQLEAWERFGVFRQPLTDQFDAVELSLKTTTNTSLQDLQQWITSTNSTTLKNLSKTTERVALPWSKLWYKNYPTFRKTTLQYLELGGRRPSLPSRTVKGRQHFVDPYDEAAPLEERARSYLHANCAHCHVEAGGGNAAINLHKRAAREALRMIDVPPLHDSFGVRDPLLIAPGQADRSLLYLRVKTNDRGRMPPLSRLRVDERAAEMLRAWITSIPPTEAAPDRVPKS